MMGDTDAVRWRIDRLDSIGGKPTTVWGRPRIIDTPEGKAVEFDGVGDGFLVDDHPLSGWPRFTLEIVFRPDAGGLKEQRFLHLHESSSNQRILIETRLTDDDRWFLDTFIASGAGEQALIAKDCLHPVGRWYRAALVYDGADMRHYVDGALELSAALKFTPHLKGGTSIGVRSNKVFWFKGAIREIRFTPRPLSPGELLR
jgi:hypothetical protein